MAPLLCETQTEAKFLLFINYTMNQWCECSAWLGKPFSTAREPLERIIRHCGKVLL